jgi:hypothetical protein
MADDRYAAPLRLGPPEAKDPNGGDTAGAHDCSPKGAPATRCPTSSAGRPAEARFAVPGRSGPHQDRAGIAPVQIGALAGPKRGARRAAAPPPHPDLRQRSRLGDLVLAQMPALMQLIR